MFDFRKRCCKILPVFQIIFILIWLSNLASTDAYFSVYVIIAFISFYLVTRKQHPDETEKRSKPVLAGVLSLIFSFVVLLANYTIFTQLRDPALIGRSTNLMVNLINTLFSFIGGICVAYPILNFAFQSIPLKVYGKDSFRYSKVIPVVIFGSLVCINLIHLFLVEYPGNVTEDPFTQISEMISGQYSNFNTFWHTMIFRSVLSLGYALFSDLNVSIAFFCIFQIFVLAFAFTYSLMTMFHYGVPKAFLVAAYLGYAIVPYNIALSITIWKDVLLASGCLLMVSAWLRILKNFGGHSVWNYIIFVVGSLLFLLSRTNGWIIYLISFVVFALVVRKNKNFIAVMGAMAVLGWVLLNPVLSMLNIPGSDVVESLSIPIQQVSRVISDGCDLSEDEEALISRVVDIEEVPVLYTSWLSDPMKEEIRSKDLSYFENNLADYAKLWLQLGIKHPVSYLKAWVDQTKGYWNGGYDYFLYAETITDNPYGVEKTGSANIVASLFRLYFGLSRHVIFFEPLHSIGLHVWIVVLCFILNAARKRDEFVISVPILVLVLGLWFGTPVYCSFRYVYPLFVSFPLIVSTTLYLPEEK